MLDFMHDFNTVDAFARNPKVRRFVARVWCAGVWCAGVWCAGSCLLSLALW